MLHQILLPFLVYLIVIPASCNYPTETKLHLITILIIKSLTRFLNIYRRRRSHSPRHFRRGRTPPNGLGYRDSPFEEISAEERDSRTIFCMQLSQRVRARDLEEFFSSVGKVRDVRLITCNKTKRFKGIAYVEFKDPESGT